MYLCKKVHVSALQTFQMGLSGRIHGESYSAHRYEKAPPQAPSVLFQRHTLMKIPRNLRRCCTNSIIFTSDPATFGRNTSGFIFVRTASLLSWDNRAIAKRGVAPKKASTYHSHSLYHEALMLTARSALQVIDYDTN